MRFLSNKRDAIHVNSKAKLTMVACTYSGNAKTRVTKSGGRIITA